MDSPLTAHLVNRLEQHDSDLSFARVDGDTVDNLIKKDEEIPNKLEEAQIEKVQTGIPGSSR